MEFDQSTPTDFSRYRMDLSEERSYARLPQNKKKGVLTSVLAVAAAFRGRPCGLWRQGLKLISMVCFLGCFLLISKTYFQKSLNSNVDHWFSMILFICFPPFSWGKWSQFEEQILQNGSKKKKNSQQQCSMPQNKVLHKIHLKFWIYLRWWLIPFQNRIHRHTT